MLNIVILGGGFGGVRTALELNKRLSFPEATITVIDRNNYHLFLPSLYEVASAYGVESDPYHLKLRKTISIPYAEIFRHTRVNFVQAEINRVDLLKKEVATAGEKFFTYDYLVIGLGGETDTLAIPGVSDYAYKFKTIDEAIFLNQQILALYQKAARGRHSLPVKFIIVGAGFNGIELAGELACCVDNIKNACKLGKGCVSIKVVEAGPQILPMIYDQERKIIEKRLITLGVDILKNSLIKEVGPNFVKIGERGEKLGADFVIWMAGMRAASFLKNIAGLKLNSRGKIVINSFLQAEGQEGVWALGDNTIFIDPETQKPIPGLAYVAINQGKVIAENIVRTIKNRKLRTYQPFYSVWIAPVGGKYAVAHLGKMGTLSGKLGWLARVLVDLRYFLSILPISKALALLGEETDVFFRND